MSKYVENPRTLCALNGGMGVVGAINRAIPILHSGPGCGLQASIGTQIDYLGGGTGCPSTNTYEKEIVFGGEQRLRETIQGAIEIIDGDLYVVLSGCTAGIIGDDIQSVVHEFSDSGYQVIGVETAGFKGDTLYGYDVTMTSIVKALAHKTEKEPTTVNFFGLVPQTDITVNGDLEEIERIFRLLGVKVNTFFFAEDGIEQLRNSGNAALNINISPYLLKDLEKFYQSEFAIDTIHYPGIPIGPTATSEFVRLIGEVLSLDKELIEKVIFEEEDYVYNYFQKLSAMITTYRYVLVGDVNTVLGYNRFLTNDYGQIPYVTIITDREVSEADKEKISIVLNQLEYARKPIIYYEEDKYQIGEIIREYQEQANLILGSSYEREIASELEIFNVVVSYPCTEQMILNKSHCGYRGSVTIVEDMYNNN